MDEAVRQVPVRERQGQRHVAPRRRAPLGCSVAPCVDVGAERDLLESQSRESALAVLRRALLGCGLNLTSKQWGSQ